MSRKKRGVGRRGSRPGTGKRSPGSGRRVSGDAFAGRFSGGLSGDPAGSLPGVLSGGSSGLLSLFSGPASLVSVLPSPKPKARRPDAAARLAAANAARRAKRNPAPAYDPDDF